MPASANKIKNPVLKYLIKVKGKDMHKVAPVLSIAIDQNLFKVSTAKVQFALTHQSGDNKMFEPADRYFDLGHPIEISVGYEEKQLETIFKGIIICLLYTSPSPRDS